MAAGFFMLGVGFSPIFPALLHSTSENFAADYTQAMIGTQMAAAFLGNAIVPLIFGALAQTIGYQIFPAILITLLALLTITVTKLYKRK
jgi:fucose permease